MSEEKINDGQLAEAKSGLTSTEKISHEKLKSILKCTICGNTMEIPPDVKERMENDEAPGTLPMCKCGGSTALSVISS